VSIERQSIVRSLSEIGWHRHVIVIAVSDACIQARLSNTNDSSKGLSRICLLLAKRRDRVNSNHFAIQILIATSLCVLAVLLR
jgi:hypothetical protein